MNKAILVISERIPFPFDNGGKLRTANILIRLSKEYEVDFVGYSIEPVAEAQLEVLRQYCRTVKCFAEGLPPITRRLAHFLTGKSSISFCIYSKNMQNEIDQLIRENSYRIIWVERLFCYPYVEKLPTQIGPPPPVILDMHDVDHEAVRFFGDVEKKIAKKLYYKAEFPRVIRLEKKAFKNAHRIIAVSERDMELYRGKYNFAREKWLYANNGVDLSIAAGLPGFERDKNTVLFVGGMDNPSNRHGIEWLIDSVWSKVVARNPAAQLLVAGSGHVSGEFQAKMSGATNVRFLGYVDDVYELYRKCACIVVPLLSGSGTRLKIVEAFSFRLPVISTPIGAEGLPVQSERDLLISDDQDTFADCILRVLASSELRETLTANGYEIAKNHYDWDRIVGTLIHDVEESLPGARTKELKE